MSSKKAEDALKLAYQNSNEINHLSDSIYKWREQLYQRVKKLEDAQAGGPNSGGRRTRRRRRKKRTRRRKSRRRMRGKRKGKTRRKK